MSLLKTRSGVAKLRLIVLKILDILFHLLNGLAVAVTQNLTTLVYLLLLEVVLQVIHMYGSTSN